MFERVKYAVINCIACILFCVFFGFASNDVQPLFIILIALIAIADVAFLDGAKYGNCAYMYLIFNRILSFIFVLSLSITAKEFFYWMGFFIYCIEMPNVIFNQWGMIEDDILIEEMEDNYQYTMYELDTLLSKEQKHVLETLESIVDEDKMYVFIATFHPKEIQKLLKVELWGLAFLIQKEDYDKMTKLAQEIE